MIDPYKEDGICISSDEESVEIHICDDFGKQGRTVAVPKAPIIEWFKKLAVEKQTYILILEDGHPTKLVDSMEKFRNYRVPKSIKKTLLSFEIDDD